MQFKFFKDVSDEVDIDPNLPKGLRYQPELISPSDENTLLSHVRELPFKEFDFHGYKGKRRTVSFGWQYEFSGAGRLRKADDIPDFLLGLRMRAAAFAEIEPDSLQHVLVIEYGLGAGIGWHSDKPVFGEVIGVSLLAPCVLRFRRKEEKAEGESGKGEQGKRVTGKRKRDEVNVKQKWERVNLFAEPRSAYHLNGPARWEWQHSILRVNELRYSITFRNVLESDL